MKQHLVTVESGSASKYENDINELLEEGYLIAATHIRGIEVGSYDEGSVYQAILVKDIIEEKSKEHVKINFDVANASNKELEDLLRNENS